MMNIYSLLCAKVTWLHFVAVTLLIDNTFLSIVIEDLVVPLIAICIKFPVGKLLSSLLGKSLV